MMNINLEFFSGLKKNSIEFWYAKKMCSVWKEKRWLSYFWWRVNERSTSVDSNHDRSIGDKKKKRNRKKNRDSHRAVTRSRAGRLISHGLCVQRTQQIFWSMTDDSGLCLCHLKGFYFILVLYFYFGHCDQVLYLLMFVFIFVLSVVRPFPVLKHGHQPKKRGRSERKKSLYAP